MKFKKYILTGTLALLLSSTAIATIEGNKADASSKKDYIIQSEFHDKRIAEELRTLLNKSNVYALAAGSLNPYYKRTIMMNIELKPHLGAITSLKWLMLKLH